MAQTPVYWLDTNVLIEAKNGPYQFDVAPVFWSALETQVSAGRIRVPKMVYEEIVGDAPKDELAKWLKLRKSDGFCVSPSKQVQASFQKLADHVVANYAPPYSFEFLKVADPWIIAHAMESKGVVVTFEVKSLGTGRVKIPNICADLDVPRMNLYAMMKALGIKFPN
jgi:hypothetical protein